MVRPPRPLRRHVVPGAVAALLGLVLGAAPAIARADVTKDQCVDANTAAQGLRREGKFKAARAQLLVCQDARCPAIIRDDCTRRTEEIERVQPTIVFDAKDATGRDVSAVQVAVDGQPVADTLDGTALRVDAGSHVFTFTVAGQLPVTQTFVLKEGEKDRRERIVFGPPPPTPATPAAPAPAALPEVPPASGEPSNGGKVLGLVLGGAGVAGIAVGSVFGLMTAHEASQQKTDCASATSCANYASAASDHSSARTDGLVSTIGFAAGGALLAGGAVVFLLAGHSAASSPATGFLVVPAFGPGGGMVSLTRGF